MSTYESESIARAIIADRVREATQRRLAREARHERTEQPGPVAKEWHLKRPAPLWRLVHGPHWYG